MRLPLLFLFVGIFSPCAEPISLFNGENLSGWRLMRQDRFVYPGNVEVHEKALVLGAGQPGTGIICTRPNLPRMNYEISWECCRLEGFDFFCGLTFPVEKTYQTLVLGGWDGDITGIGVVNGADASQNETSISVDYKQGQWYRVKLRVTKDMITVWLDDAVAVTQNIDGRTLTLHPAMTNMVPLSLSTWSTKAAYRNILLRPL